MDSVSTRYASAFTNPSGPGDARPTAREIVSNENLIGKLENLTILITGCSSGIGVETARALYETGAQIFITVRNKEKAVEVIDDIVKNSPIRNRHPIQVIELELDNLASVRAAGADFLSRSKQLNILITNAGVMASPPAKSKDGFELQFAVNHLAHFLLFQLLKPLLLKSSTKEFQSRVISLSSIAHRFGSVRFDDLDFSKSQYDKFLSYGQSKTANIYFANEIERRFSSKGLHAFSVHPGGIWTKLTRHLGNSDVEGFKANDLLARSMKSPEQGAATTVWAAISKDLEGKGGLYLEDCQASKPFAGTKEQIADFGLAGYAPHTYDQEAENKLWNISSKMVQFDD